jgi:hypothetical protein
VTPVLRCSGSVRFWSPSGRSHSGMSVWSRAWLRCIGMQADGSLTAACLIRPAASDESAAAPDSRSLARPMCRAPPRWLISRRLSPARCIAGADSCRLAFPGGCAVFSGFLERRGSRGRSHLRCEIVAAAPGPGRWYPDPWPASPRTGTPACRMQKGREAAYIWQAVPKEATPCRSSGEGQSGRTS